MKRIIQALAFSVIIIATVSFLSRIFHRPQEKDLNIVLISVDTVRPDHLSTYGYKRNTDPNLKKLAEHSTVFENVFTLIPQTYPSFAMMFTGKSPFSTGIFSNASPLLADEGKLFENTARVTDKTETMASILQKNGYKTVSFITSGILHDDLTGLSHGFDSYNQFSENDINEWKQDRESYDSFIETSTNWFAENRQEKFFYWIHLMDPHSPYYPPSDTRCLFQSDGNCKLIKEQSFSEINSFNSPYYACSSLEAPIDVIDRYSSLYDAEIMSSDRQVGEIIDALERYNLMENTIIIYYSDHGESFEHQYYFAHGESLYNSTLRIPLIIYNPLQKARKIVAQQVTNLDILPTILDLAQIPYTKDQFDGENIVSKDDFSANDNPIYFSNYNLTKFAVIKGQYKFILSRPNACLYGGAEEELYNIISDSEEKQNLVTLEPAIAGVLKKALEEHISDLQITPSGENQSENDTMLEELKSLGY